MAIVTHLFLLLLIFAVIVGGILFLCFLGISILSLIGLYSSRWLIGPLRETLGPSSCRRAVRSVSISGIDITTAHGVFERWSKYGRNSPAWWMVCFCSPVDMKAKITYTEPFRDEPAHSRSFDSAFSLKYCEREGQLFCRFQQFDGAPVQLSYTWYGSDEALSSRSNTDSVLMRYIIDCIESELRKKSETDKFEIAERQISNFSYPSSADFADAVQAPAITFSDPDLKRSTPVLDSLGLPVAASGNFATVFRLAGQEKDWAVRCFNSPLAALEQYSAIDQYFRAEKTACLLPFEFLREGATVRGRTFPIIKMEWVSGQTLDCYVREHLQNASALELVRERFKCAIHELKERGIVHGDLQHGNILISERFGLTLVDYDTVCLPGLQRTNMPELGHRNYQHPLRSHEHVGSYLDNFSAWVIDLSLQCLSLDPSLWEHWKGDECLLFKREDFADPTNSKLINAMRQHSSEDIVSAATQLLSYASLPIEQVPFLQTVLSIAPQPLSSSQSRI